MGPPAPPHHTVAQGHSMAALPLSHRKLEGSCQASAKHYRRTGWLEIPKVALCSASRFQRPLKVPVCPSRFSQSEKPQTSQLAAVVPLGSPVLQGCILSLSTCTSLRTRGSIR